MKTIDNLMAKGKMSLVLLTSLFVLGGCTGMGAAMSTSNDPKTRLIGTLMYHEGLHQDKMKEAKEGETKVNISESQRDFGYNTQQSPTTPVNQGEYFIVVNLATGKSETIIGPHWDIYGKVIQKKKRAEYPEGYMIYFYDNGKRLKTSTWERTDGWKGPTQFTHPKGHIFYRNEELENGKGIWTSPTAPSGSYLNDETVIKYFLK